MIASYTGLLRAFFYGILIMSALKLEVSEILQSLGFELIALNIFSRGPKKILEILMDRLDSGAVRIEDCVKVSDYLSVVFDQNEPLDGAYNLEVSSAGIDRPLNCRRHFEKFKNKMIYVNLCHETEGIEKIFTGELLDVLDNKSAVINDDIEQCKVVDDNGQKDNEDFSIKVQLKDKKIHEIKFLDIKKAKLHPEF